MTKMAAMPSLGENLRTFIWSSGIVCKSSITSVLYALLMGHVIEVLILSTFYLILVAKKSTFFFPNANLDKLGRKEIGSAYLIHVIE